VCISHLTHTHTHTPIITSPLPHTHTHNHTHTQVPTDQPIFALDMVTRFLKRIPFTDYVPEPIVRVGACVYVKGYVRVVLYVCEMQCGCASILSLSSFFHTHTHNHKQPSDVSTPVTISIALAIVLVASAALLAAILTYTVTKRMVGGSSTASDYQTV
jgi:hypothetical protein